MKLQWFKFVGVKLMLLFLITPLNLRCGSSHVKSSEEEKTTLESEFIQQKTFNNNPILNGNKPTFNLGEDPKPKQKVWEKVDNMSDEFNGDYLNTAKWQKEPVGNSWMWIGRPPGLFKASNVSVKNGSLNVVVSKLSSPETINGKKFTHQGGIVRSKNSGKVGWYFECKMKANKTVMSSTFWLMTKYDCEKKLELDIQECVGRTTEKTKEWAKDWDKIYHSNTIHRKTSCNPESIQKQGSIATEDKNWERFFVYGAWWKSKEEVQFFLDGKYVYSIKPSVEWDMPAYLHMAIETYDWNPIPDDGGIFDKASEEERTTQYKWIRTWKLKSK